MVPKFTSMSDMIGFIRALPKNANYTKMLATDFGVVAPADAPEYQKEYLWKYLVQGVTRGDSQESLMKNAVEGVEKLAKTLPHLTWEKKNGEPVAPASKTSNKVTVVKSGRVKGARVGTFDASKGACRIEERDGKFWGFIGDVMIANSPNRNFIVKRFGIFGRKFGD